MKRTWVVCGACCAAAALAAAAALGAFAGGTTSRAASAAHRNPDAVGVTVHGNWKLQVRQPSGRVVRTYRFHNDLYPGFGSTRIANALLGNETLGSFEIYLFAAGVSQMPCSGGQGCGTIKPGWSGVGHTFPNLIQSTIAGGLRLKGSVIADNDGQIAQVWTYLFTCPKTVASSDCDDASHSGFSVFTSRVLPSVVPVLAGQQVLATVDITFS